MKERFDVRAWLVWLVAASVATLVARNPLYTIIILLVARVVYAACRLPGQGVQLVLWRIGLIIVLFSTLFNALMVHVGETVLFRLPSGLWLVGGPVTLEAAVYGAINGLILVALLAVFLTFNSVVTVAELVRLTPRALHNLGVVVLIAMTYIPETRQQWQRIQEAQAVRGHQLRGVRDWQPILIPLLIGSLERAMNLAETMVARGYGATAGTERGLLSQLLLLAALVLALGGWALSFWFLWPGRLLLLAGAAVAILLYWQLGRSVMHTQYRPSPWRWRDSLLVAVGLLSLMLVVVPLPFVDRTTLFYSPYPALSLPAFDPVIGLGLSLLAAPALLVEV